MFRFRRQQLSFVHSEILNEQLSQPPLRRCMKEFFLPVDTPLET